MFFSIKELEVREIPFNQDFQAGEIQFFDRALKQLKPLHAEGTAALLPHSEGEVRITGRITTEIGAECDRCLGEVVVAIDAPIHLLYHPATELEGGEEEEIEIHEGDTDIAFYEGKGIELEQVIAEQIVLLLPMQVVCEAGCKGICPVCGGNRNQTECKCQAVPPDERWSALKDLVN
jgi:uncharacterized protein